MVDINAPLKKSEFVQVVQEGESAIIWHSLFGHPKVVTTDVVEFLDGFSEPSTLREQLGEVSADEAEALSELVEGFFLVPPDFSDRAFLEARMREREAGITDGSRIDFLELIMSEECNFRCTYCIHFNNLETSDRINNPSKFMRFEVAQRIIDEYLNILAQHDKRTAEINFGGGEPLMAWDVIEQVLNYCRDVYGGKFEFRYSINTNASLITPDIAAVLRDHKVEIASSLDGLKEGNDQVRLNKGGRGTFNNIMKGFDALEAAGYPLEGIAVTVTQDNFGQLDESIVDWAIARGMGDVRIDIDVVGMVEVPVEEIVEKLIRIRRYALERGIEVPGFWSRPSENLNESTLEQDVSFCGAVRGNSMCVSPTGNIYGCGYSTTKLGDLLQIKKFHEPEGNYHRFVRDHLTGTMEMCKGCMIEGQCGGGCNITQEFARATSSAKIDRMCDFYRLMTQEILRGQLRELATT
ncbi:MAG TPA: radical SAM protein [Candidatus Saccharimonadales bacterium]|nr:radical SAM protein [Candidatus Saccharimonadales bacterium]